MSSLRGTSLFCYGTLQAPEVVGSVIGRVPENECAVLQGYARLCLQDLEYPGILRRDEGVVPGLIYHELKEAEVVTLDRFEGGMYDRVEVAVEVESGGMVNVFTYSVKDEFHSLLRDVPWFYEDFLAQGMASFMAHFVRDRKGREF